MDKSIHRFSTHNHLNVFHLQSQFSFVVPLISVFLIRVCARSSWSFSVKYPFVYHVDFVVSSHFFCRYYVFPRWRSTLMSRIVGSSFRYLLEGLLSSYDVGVRCWMLLRDWWRWLSRFLLYVSWSCELCVLLGISGLYVSREMISWEWS